MRVPNDAESRHVLRPGPYPNALAFLRGPVRAQFSLSETSALFASNALTAHSKCACRNTDAQDDRDRERSDRPGQSLARPSIPSGVSLD